MTHPQPEHQGERELLPCPFCAGAARIESNRDWHRIYAAHDDDCVLDADDHDLMYPAQPGYLIEIANTWNRRPALAQAPASGPTVEVKRNRIWIVKGVQSFMLAYEADTDEELQWYAGQLRGVLSAFTPDVNSVAQAPAEAVACDVSMVTQRAAFRYAKLRTLQVVLDPHDHKPLSGALLDYEIDRQILKDSDDSLMPWERYRATPPASLPQGAEARDAVSIVLTAAQLRKLEDVLQDYQDEGPTNAGWASAELHELRDIVGEAAAMQPKGEKE